MKNQKENASSLKEPTEATPPQQELEQRAVEITTSRSQLQPKEDQ
jgi:hypothetical protein